MEENQFQNAWEAEPEKYRLASAAATENGNCGDVPYHLIKR
jgi:hypothetical protein